MTDQTASVQRFGRNALGRDWVVGDIHGAFSALQRRLDALGFDPAQDRLFCVGDLVDRGPESPRAEYYLQQPWFHSVCGNHDDFVIRAETCDQANWLHNGGAWFFELDAQDQKRLQARFAHLPVVIEVETAAGPVGLVHAECPFENWQVFLMELTNHQGRKWFKRVRECALWSRDRIQCLDTRPVTGVRAVVAGHTRVTKPTVLGNVHYIETSGWRPGGHFTILDLQTLQSL